MLYLYHRKIQRQRTHLRNYKLTVRASQGILLLNLITSWCDRITDREVERTDLTSPNHNFVLCKRGTSQETYFARPKACDLNTARANQSVSQDS